MATKKLQVREDWKLAGSSGPAVLTRTRGGGNGRPDIGGRIQRLLSFQEEAIDVDEEVESSAMASLDPQEDEDLLVEEDSDVDDDEDEDGKPSSSRVILEVKALRNLLRKHCVCPECGGPLESSLDTTCLATSVSLECPNSDCGYLFLGDGPAGTKIKHQDKRERMSDYALNLLYVLGFVSCGDGGAEAGRLLGLLGLPNDTTMERRSFGIIEESMSPFIKELTDTILLDNLAEEVRVTVKQPNQYALWKQSIEGSIELDATNYPRIRVSFDMAWQQRNSGNRYASLSGHGLFVGGYTRKPITLCIKSKLCCYCKAWKKRHGDLDPPPEHTCYNNYEGSSGGMEPIACLDLTEMMYRKFHCVVDLICADDDSSTRSLLKWSNADYMKNNNTTEPPQVPVTKGPNVGKPHVRPDKGRLPSDIPEPTFVADPNHRKKVLTGELIALDTAKVADKATMTRMDSTRIGKNFGYMIRTLKNLPEDQYCYAAKAVLEHHFDNHVYCGEWCRRRTMNAAQQQESIRFYRSMTTDAKLYGILSKKLERFITLERLKEVAHGMDTQVNESFNNTASWFAPKNKVYCGTSSLTNRICVALGVNSLGLLAYFKRLFAKLGIMMTKNVLYYLMMKDRTRNSRLERIKSKAKKTERIQKKNDALRRDEATARKERKKREGTYKSGINMQGNNGYTQEEIDEAQAPPSNKRKRTVATCPHCQLQGHSTRRSRKCLQYNGPAPLAPVQAAEDANADIDPAADIDDTDACPLVHDPQHVDTEEEVEALRAFLAAANDSDVGIVRATL
jgi:hypothetical protein